MKFRTKHGAAEVRLHRKPPEERRGFHVLVDEIPVLSIWIWEDSVEVSTYQDGATVKSYDANYDFVKKTTDNGVELSIPRRGAA